MSHDEDDDGETQGPTLVTMRTMDIVVALVLIGLSALVIFDSTRIGHGWEPGLGPAAGYYPFYIAAFMGISSVIVLLGALFKPGPGWSRAFATKTSLLRVLSVLLPAFAYVALIQFLGIYVASAIFIAAFMVFVGGDNPLMAIAVGTGVPVALFFMFEKWFLVPLPKGPLEAMLGY